MATSSLTPLEQYRQQYFLSSVVIDEDGQHMIVDQHQRFTLDIEQPIYFLDLDHTILNTNALKDLLSNSLTKLNISPGQYQQAYHQAKDDQNFYDFHKHLEILSTLIAPEHPVEAVPQKIQDYLFDTINSSVKSLVYPNIAAWLQQVKPRNVMIDTSGTGEWQRQKVAACLTSMDWQPQAVILIENAHKGWVIDKLHQLVSSKEVPSPRMIIVDDNAEEVADIAQANQKLNLNLSIFRVKQVGGQYNNQPTPTNLDIHELDFVSQPQLNLRKELAS